MHASDELGIQKFMHVVPIDVDDPIDVKEHQIEVRSRGTGVHAWWALKFEPAKLHAL